MLSQALAVARQTMRAEVLRARGVLDRDQLELSAKLLETHSPRLCERFPAVLLDVFRNHADSGVRRVAQSSQRLHMDQLELMDESEVQERVELARMLQHVLLEAESALPELNTYVCALVGLERVSPERNPLRPDSYVMALQQLMIEMLVPTQVRALWLRHLSAPLGVALRDAYLEWSGQLQRQDVRRVGFAVIRTPDVLPATGPGDATRAEGAEGTERAERAVWSPQYRQTVLTLDGLRRLMAGNLDVAPVNPKEAFAQQFARDFESSPQVHATKVTVGQPPDTGFAATVPAALDALQEMQQVDAVVQRMQRQHQGDMDARAPGTAVRVELTRNATTMSQVLSLEVVALMVENLVKDKRLLPAVRKVIERLEPALLRLVIIDPRFFIDKTHPARKLLNELSQRGLAFGSEEDPGFEAFLLSLQRHVSPLAVLNIDGVQPFETALKQLLKEWDNPIERASASNQLQSAATVLDYAEERNLLAGQMSANLMAIPDARKVPSGVFEFLSGPWAQVMAEAQLKAAPGSDDPGGYKALVNDLLWSAQPDQARKDTGRLIKLVPRLLSGLREGLGLIGYPSAKTSVFFDVLMQLHHQAFRPRVKDAPAVADQGLDAGLLGNQDHWVAPAEAEASGFMELPDEEAADIPKDAPFKPVPAVSSVTLKLGAWVELRVGGVWQRVQLSWISTHGTMFLFTSVGGKTQSMTQRVMERLLAEDKLRVVSEQTSMVEDALDAVVQAAMLNSIVADL